ncbi:MAG: hypothetical protein V9H25_13625 [Candidatus Competibacter sp.]
MTSVESASNTGATWASSGNSTTAAPTRQQARRARIASGADGIQPHRDDIARLQTQEPQCGGVTLDSQQALMENASQRNIQTGGIHQVGLAKSDGLILSLQFSFPSIY